MSMQATLLATTGDHRKMRSNTLSLRSTFRPFVLFALAFCAVPLAVAACGDGEAPANGTTDDGGAATPADAASSQSDGSTASADGNPGETPADSGNDAPTSSGGTGLAALGGGDGITGTIGGTALTFTTQAVHIPQGNDAVVIGARFTDYTQSWTLRMKPTLGAQDCTGDVDIDDVSIAYAKVPDYENGGTTTSPGTCTINLTSLTPKIEGTFVATLKSGTPIAVTDGAFRITP